MAGAVGCAVAVAVSGELSPGAHVAVVVAGALVIGLGLVRRAGRTAPPVGRKGLPWLVWVAAAGAWELAALGSDRLPTVSDLADPILAHPVVRAAAVLAWLAGGVWLITRPSGPVPR